MIGDGEKKGVTKGLRKHSRKRGHQYFIHKVEICQIDPLSMIIVNKKTQIIYTRSTVFRT